ncbi:hypothetical protein BKA70DRAFT_1371925 [Coprinopsis sp. MPI-PUGE-AT-0042]|nr:hypothetical protein BKA70DRAFT_1371925 [Coprinopsis sp. MPI-PUGE-AT-0042]
MYRTVSQRTHTTLRRWASSAARPPRHYRRRSFPFRGGQNLSDRYRRLQTSLRGKESRTREVEFLESVVEGSREDATTALDSLPLRAEETQAVPTADGQTIESSTAVGSGKGKDEAQRFKGLVIPRKPDPPADDECCMSGCAICVYDLYDESLSAYDVSVVQVRKALVEMGSSILPKSSATAAKPTVQATVRDAFEEMERALQKKKEAREAAANDSTAVVPPTPTSIPPFPPSSVQATAPSLS